MLEMRNMSKVIYVVDKDSKKDYKYNICEDTII